MSRFVAVSDKHSTICVRLLQSGSARDIERSDARYAMLLVIFDDKELNGLLLQVIFCTFLNSK